jgi:hypothetical protein
MGCNDDVSGGEDSASQVRGGMSDNNDVNGGCGEDSMLR